MHGSKPLRSRILIVDDHPVTRKGLCEVIAAESALEVCGETDAWREALEKVHAQRPDLIVLDLHLKDGHGMELLDHMQAKGPHTPVLVLSACDETIYAIRLLKSGALGYLMKTVPVAKVLEAIHKVLAGHVAVSDVIATRLIRATVQDGGKTRASADFDVLSNLELQVAELLRLGLNNRNIAERLGVSPKTVGTYKIRLMEKLGTRTTPELLAHVQAALP